MDDDAAGLMERMRQNYLAESSKKIENLNRLLDAWAGSPADMEVFKAFERAIHNLRGSGASYGVPRISEAARIYEGFLDWFRREKLTLNPKRLEVMREAIQELGAIFAGERNGLPVDIPSCRVLTIFRQSIR